MKHEWKKHEKNIYLPKTKPIEIDVPAFKYFMIEGKGNPNDDFFAEYIGVLYSLSYAVRMSPKKGFAPPDYFEYTVYPLEGVWDLAEDAKADDVLNKDKLIFNLMMRQPNFVTPDFAQKIIESTKIKKPHELLSKVNFGEICDGKSVQMMHMGSYDDEPESFREMQEFCDENNLVRLKMSHREIYLSDARKVVPEKLKTVLRFQVFLKKD